MEFSSYFRTFGNPDFTAGFSGGGDVHQPLPLSPPCRDAARPPSLFHVPEVDAEETHHFLEECSLCGKALSGDIFMYRGDTPFCSEECRREQMEMDRAKYQQRKKQATAHATAAPKEHRRQQPPQKRRSHRIPVGS